MKNVRVFIVEDNESFALEVEMMLKEAGYELVGIADNSEQALKEIKSKKPDLVLMDIDIRGKKDGVTVAKEIKDDKIPVVFMSSINDTSTYNETKKANSFAYLVKPFDMLSLRSSVEQAVKILDNKQPKEGSGNFAEWEGEDVIKGNLLIKDRGILKKVNIKDILYVESDWNYCVLVTESKRFVVKMSLKKILDKFGDDFIAIHKSYFVQMDKIDGIDTTSNKVVIGETLLPLGRTFKEELLRKFDLLK